MAWLADAHREWHYVHGALTVCPLDCGVGEDVYDEFGDDEEAYAEAQVTPAPLDWADCPF